MPGAGRQRLGRTETLLSALRRPRLPPPRALATAGKQRRPRTFLRSEGRSAGRTVPGLQSGTPRRRDPAGRWSPGCKKREAPPPRLERGATGSGDPGRRTGALPPRPASGAPASAPLFPPGLKAPGAERPRESSAGRGALAAPPGARRRRRRRAGARDAGARLHKPRRTLQRRNRSAE